ncbi:ABC transporter permease [Pilimelia columellifera]|uniref:Transport permease protein n=1 Tax=Pilimelia columellifera subsp. columellifera TaxID=706583 RepID=A0ABN3N4T2_9ACTN
MTTAVIGVFEYQWVAFRRVWRSSVTMSFILPLLTILGFGVGVGAYVPSVEGLPYLSFVVAGLLASTAMQTAVGDATWPVLDAFIWNRLHYAQAAAPPSPADIAVGRLLYIVSRVMIPVVVFLAVAYAFGVPRSVWALASVPVCAALAWATVGPCMALSAAVDSDLQLNLLYRLVVLPMTLFSGVFFPVEQLPEALRWLSFVFPLWHGVDLCRVAMLGVDPSWPVWAHLTVLVAWGVAGTWVMVRVFARRLVQ